MACAAFLLLILGVSAPAYAAGSDCDSASTLITDCTIDNPGDQVDVGGVIEDPGDHTDGDGPGDGDGPTTGSPPVEPCIPSAEDLCRGGYEVGGLPDVTMEDLASFRPAAPSLASEPAGVGIVGMPTNFVTGAAVHEVGGTLFAYAVAVRFTPIGYVFTHGDGTSDRSPTSGATWDALGQPDFTATATSHAYAERGTFTATASVQYRAEIDFGGGWRNVPGTLTLTSGGYPVRIVEARTGLVDRSCLEDPTGPGC